MLQCWILHGLQIQVKTPNTTKPEAMKQVERIKNKSKPMGGLIDLMSIWLKIQLKLQLLTGYISGSRYQPMSALPNNWTGIPAQDLGSANKNSSSAIYSKPES